MNSGEILGAIAIGLAVMLAIALLAFSRSVVRAQKAVTDLDATVAALRTEVASRNADLDRVDGLLERADRISSRVESTSRTLATPVIKAFAAGAGTTRAARRLRRGQTTDS
ncbi:MAG: hypothetical protein H0W70_03240 [Actinobacteria bacterium]|nr:hypothetical protein [Actinomycetota bacterium]